jgi:hypothetical protein
MFRSKIEFWGLWLLFPRLGAIFHRCQPESVRWMLPPGGLVNASLILQHGQSARRSTQRHLPLQWHHIASGAVVNAHPERSKKYRRAVALPKNQRTQQLFSRMRIIGQMLQHFFSKIYVAHYAHRLSSIQNVRKGQRKLPVLQIVRTTSSTVTNVNHLATIIAAFNATSHSYLSSLLLGLGSPILSSLRQGLSSE